MIKLDYPGKKPEKEILSAPPLAALQDENGVLQRTLLGENWLIASDNLNALNWMLQECDMAGTIDMVYIDPPFATNKIFRHDETRVSTISSKNTSPVAYLDLLTGASFLEFLRERLILLREVMADHGSIYLHIDYKVGHYVKILMDEIFGPTNFRADIARIKCNPKNFKRRNYGNQKDLLLFYTKSKDYVWNEPLQPFSRSEEERLYPKIDSSGRRYTTVPLHAPGETRNGPTGRAWRGLLPPAGRHWRCAPDELEELDRQYMIEWSKTGNPRRIIYADESSGRLLQDVWDMRDSPYPSYPTEKNSDMLKTIISTSSNPGQTVLDCFCGSASTLIASVALDRHAIGVDQSPAAISVSQRRILETPGCDFAFASEYTDIAKRYPTNKAEPATQLTLLQKRGRYAVKKVA
ncbi:site-specific DNA-methyltransferase [Ferrigenium sp. UT5]|uniref:site-specific DNA-methyltransferase n=1 Tax=Ferrigenium sp. UT5 TaxID=3242105 RepID=UPI00354B7861